MIMSTLNVPLLREVNRIKSPAPPFGRSDPFIKGVKYNFTQAPLIKGVNSGLRLGGRNDG